MHKSKVIKLIKETHDTWTIQFERPENFDYKPGQYCIFEKKMGDELIRRSYSLSSSPTEEFLQITVKHIPNGKMSTYLTQCSSGEVLKYNGPIGKFVFDETYNNVVFIAGGSGISPFRSMLKYVLDKKLQTKVTVIYGSRSPKDIILKEELEEHNKRENVNLYLTVDYPDEEWKFHSGFIDIDFIKEATKNDLFDKDYFLIGPPPMVTNVKNGLMKANVPEPQIHVDAWG